METTLTHSKSVRTSIELVIGCLFIIICDQIKIPFYPVSFTLHTFGVALLALSFPPLRTLSILLLFTTYKLTLGLNLFGMSGGYFLAFPVAGFAISYLQKKWPPFFALLAGQALIYLFGASWLSAFLGWKAGLIQGAGVFAISDLLKNLVALKVTQFWRISWRKEL